MRAIIQAGIDLGLIVMCGVPERLGTAEQPACDHRRRAATGGRVVSVRHPARLARGCADLTCRLKVRPPRLGGNKSMGVFATRATHRPNGIGQSVVKLDKVEANRLWISGIDLLDGTPILDIKPYVPYADIIRDASNGMASAAPVLIPVQWADSALQQAHREALRLQEPLVELIEQCLAQDPRPAYQTPTAEREYGAQFWDLDVRWHYPEPGLIRVLEVIAKS